MDLETNRSALTERILAGEGWDLIDCNQEYDPFFQGETVHPEEDESNYYASGSNFHDYMLEDGSRAVGRLPSDCAVSTPPSVIEGTSFHGRNHPWLTCTSSHETTGTSPFIDQHDQPDSPSLNGCENSQSPSHLFAAFPPFEPSDYASTTAYQTSDFNTFLSASANDFSDVSTSQALLNLGTWTGQIPFIRGIGDDHMENVYMDETPDVIGQGPMPISIPTSRGSHALAPYMWTLSPSQQKRQQQRYTASQPITISHSQSQVNWAPPLLSVSPESKHLPRSAPLSRSISKSERRRARTPALQTSVDLGWVAYQPQGNTNKLVPSANGPHGRRGRGRVGGLTVEQRSHAALMRRVNACNNCRKRKERCDPGIPCQSCLDHFKGDLVANPCRNFRVSDLSNGFLSARLGWHPTERSIDSFIAPHNGHVASDITHCIPLTFGFGPALHLSVHPIQIKDTPRLCHTHIVYSWPPSSSPPEKHRHAVLPAILTPEAKLNLQTDLDKHLTLLVQRHFRSFPLYCSPLSVLREVYVFYGLLPANKPHKRLLEQALKLLVLVHIGGDVALPSLSEHPALQELVSSTMSLSEPTIPTPCFIRSQFGAVMPSLALCLMKEVLLSLEQLLLGRESQEWPAALATLILVLITVESIQYHATKLPYHQSYDSIKSRERQEDESHADDEGPIKSLLAFYTACFSSQHERLHDKWESGSMSIHSSGSTVRPEDRFVESIREAAKRASPYLERKAGAKREDQDMSYFFDRLAARLLVLRTE